MGMGEIILIAVVALLVLGPERLPGAAKAIGKGIRNLRAQTKDLQQTIEQDTQIGDAVREIRGALRGDPETLYKRVTGEDFDPQEKKDEGTQHKGDEKTEEHKQTDGRSDEGAAEKIDSAETFQFAKTPPPPVPAKKADDVDPDLPLIRTSPGSWARGDQASDDDSSGDDSGDDPVHG